MKERFLKKQKGFVVSDLLVSVLIISLFTGIIATLSYNIYLSASAIKRHSTATGYIVEIFENVDKLNYNEVTSEDPNNNEEIRGLVEIFNDNHESNNNVVKARVKPETVTAWENYQYKIDISVSPYNEDDLVKTVTVKVTYKVGAKEQKLEISKVKSRENLITPNAPDLSKIELQEGQKVIPIKYEGNETWRTTSKEDTTWYNYDNGYWAIVLIYEDENTKQVGEEITITNESNIQLWVPRYAYLLEDSNITDIKFLYSDTNKIINNEGNLENLNIIGTDNPAGYTIDQNIQNQKGIWSNTDDITLNNLKYERKNK